jgi:hypothetical protein
LTFIEIRGFTDGVHLGGRYVVLSQHRYSAARWWVSRGVVALLAAAITAVAGGTVGASGYSAYYCGGQYTPAHGNCWGSDVGLGNHSWTANRATYAGTGSFDICVGIDYWPHLSPSLVSSCTQNKPTGYDALVSYCEADRQVADKDAGLGNTANQRHRIEGFATTGGC